MDPQREEMLEKWQAVRNAIMRAEQGEFLVKYMRESDFVLMEGSAEGGEAAAAAQPKIDETKNKIVGIYVDLVLKFPGPVNRDFTPEEMEQFNKGFEEAQKESENKDKG